MKKLLPMEQPKLICHHHLTSADAILRANAKDQIHKLFCAHHINCYFQNDFQQYKFVISIHDYWAMNKKYTEAQSILFLKETYRAQAIDFVSLIKKSLDVDSYVLVSCNRSYIEHAGDEEDLQYPCLIAGYDDFSHTFTIYGFDRDNRYICFHMDYTVLAEIEFIHREHVFGIVVPYAVICPELAFGSFFGCKHITHLNINAATVFIADKVDFSFTDLTDADLISPSKHFKANDVFKNELNVALIVAVKRLTKTVIREIVFLIDFENFLSG